MSQTIEEATRLRVAKFLPDAIRKTLESYRTFNEKEQEVDEAKKFSAHHTACKVAIAHLELLLKLARWADISPEDEEGYHSILAEAFAEVENHHKQRKRKNKHEQK